MTARALAKRRVLVGAGSLADARAALALAGPLSELMPADLGGVFLEEELFAELDEGPYSAFVSVWGTVQASPARLRAVLESEGKAFRKALGELTGAAEADLSFRRHRGEHVASLCTLARGWDIVVLGYAAPRPARLVIIQIGAPGPSAGDGPGLADILAKRMGAQILTAPDGDEATLLRWLNRTRAMAVVLDMRHGPIRDQAQLRRLVDAARCPVLITGADTAQGTGESPAS
ncbi:hypothetical protein [Marimonas lutisalis]|uniref:hypothetical protein n=1 Tax=Marimonas lutisalis TaxID=2545756 RepID=UPI0010F71F00|nr:hypothetical protein [Marimonas lutisalis]